MVDESCIPPSRAEPAIPVSAGFAVGDIVRVKDPQSFNDEYAKRLVERDGVVEWIGPDYIGQFKNRARVRFLKRNGRGKEFKLMLELEDLMLVGGNIE